MDPLRPFAGLIRSLWKSNTSATSRAESPAPPTTAGAEQPQGEAVEALAEATLRSRLRERIAQLGLADPRRAREAFVEVILSAELGEELSRDPAFSDVVKRVADEIAADSGLGTQLQSLLQALVEDRPAA
jgi:hypothetical protein